MVWYPLPYYALVAQRARVLFVCSWPLGSHANINPLCARHRSSPPLGPPGDLKAPSEKMTDAIFSSSRRHVSLQIQGGKTNAASNYRVLLTNIMSYPTQQTIAVNKSSNGNKLSEQEQPHHYSHPLSFR